MIVLIVQFPDRFLELLEVVGEDVINVGRDVQLIIAYHTDYSLDPLMILRPHIHHLPLSCQRFHHWRIDEVAQKNSSGEHSSSGMLSGLSSFRTFDFGGFDFLCLCTFS